MRCLWSTASLERAGDDGDADDEDSGHLALPAVRLLDVDHAAVVRVQQCFNVDECTHSPRSVPGCRSERYPMRRTPILAVVGGAPSLQLISAQKPTHHAARLQG